MFIRKVIFLFFALFIFFNNTMLENSDHNLPLSDFKFNLLFDLK